MPPASLITGPAQSAEGAKIRSMPATVIASLSDFDPNGLDTEGLISACKTAPYGCSG